MYQKLSATFLFDGRQLQPEGSVLILDENAVVVDLVSADQAGSDVQHYDGWLAPGFVNSHCHLELSHMKGLIPEKTGLVDFLTQIMQLRGANVAEKEAAMQTAAAEMQAGGIVAVGDICNTLDTLSVKKQSSIRWHQFVETMGFIPALAETRFQQAATVLNGFLENGFAATSFSPHAPYSVSKEIFELINTHTAAQPVTMHNQETLDENNFYLSKSGGFVDFFEGLGIRLDHFTAPKQSSVQAVLPYFKQQQQLILVHNTFTTADDLNWIHQSDASAAWQPPVSFCLCPNANLYIENSLPPIALLRNAGAAICLGTDSYASNHQLSIVAEINTLLTHFPTLPLDEVLGWATLNGAIALKMAEQLGSFEKGKTPGVIHLNVQQHQIASVKRIV